MTFKEYEDRLVEFDRSPGELWYYGLGLAGEVGEVVEKLKKYYRDGSIDLEALHRELGDVQWYLTRLATKTGASLESVAEGNITKLTARAATNTLHGSGDNRERTGNTGTCQVDQGGYCFNLGHFAH